MLDGVQGGTDLFRWVQPNCEGMSGQTMTKTKDQGLTEQHRMESVDIWYQDWGCQEEEEDMAGEEVGTPE